MASDSSLEIVPVDLANRREVKRFIKFHYSVYKGDSNWVAPLIVDYLEKFNPKKNPYIGHSRVQPFLAIRDGNIVGRITAHENTQHVAYHNDKVGFVGFFECIDDVAVARTLFDAAGKWLVERGLEVMRGPASFSVNGDPIGLLVQGFDSPPVVAMPYNPNYYEQLFVESGFTKAQDLYSYYYAIDGSVPERIERIARRALRNPRIVIRKPDMKHYREEIDKLKFLYNSALADNWGAVPMTDAEFDHFSKDLKLAIDPEMTYIAEYDGQPVGLSLIFADMNQAIKPANGRLLPFGLARILIKKRSINCARLPVLGVMEQYRVKGIDAIFYYKSMQTGYRRGYRHGDVSWILESNSKMRIILERSGMEIYKIFRVYDRNLSG